MLVSLQNSYASANDTITLRATKLKSVIVSFALAYEFGKLATLYGINLYYYDESYYTHNRILTPTLTMLTIEYEYSDRQYLRNGYILKTPLLIQTRATNNNFSSTL